MCCICSSLHFPTTLPPRHIFGLKGQKCWCVKLGITWSTVYSSLLSADPFFNGISSTMCCVCMRVPSCVVKVHNSLPSTHGHSFTFWMFPYSLKNTNTYGHIDTFIPFNGQQTQIYNCACRKFSLSAWDGWVYTHTALINACIGVLLDQNLHVITLIYKINKQYFISTIPIIPLQHTLSL